MGRLGDDWGRVETRARLSLSPSRASTWRYRRIETQRGGRGVRSDSLLRGEYVCTPGDVTASMRDPRNEGPSPSSSVNGTAHQLAFISPSASPSLGTSKIASSILPAARSSTSRWGTEECDRQRNNKTTRSQRSVCSEDGSFALQALGGSGGPPVLRMYCNLTWGPSFHANGAAAGFNSNPYSGHCHLSDVHHHRLQGGPPGAVQSSRPHRPSPPT